MKHLACLLVLICIPMVGFADIAPIPQHRVPFHFDSGVYSGQGEEGQPVLVYSSVVQVEGVPWISLRFREAFLDEGSHLQIRSLLDSGTQILDAASIEEWQNTSAYFNGDAVEVQLFVSGTDRDVFVQMEEVVVGEWAPGDTPESQCGPLDDRVPSGDPAAGRLLNIGCTAWLICDGRLISAGHCLSSAGSVNTVEFNVPPSMPNGTIVHPPPEDQYAANTATRVFVNGGIGNDWGVFEVFDNSITGLSPLEAQGAHFELAQDLGPPTIRITGFGVDFNNGDRNQAQQTHTGPNAGSSGTTMRYQTDTEGGNSGSPVIDEATGNAVGVHTHGGCTTGGGGNNSGTSTFNTAFWAQVGNLNCTGGDIPCTDIRRMAAACRPNGRIRVVIAMTNGSHDGESVSVTVDADSYTGTIVGTRAVIATTTGYPAGPHTVTLTDPSGCTNIPPVIATCGTDQAELEWDEEELQEALPETRLHGNYPNPFNPSTTIRYSIGENALVSLRVYNTLGQEVATLVDGFQEAGDRAVMWNGRNNDGASVASGIYIYRLQAGSTVLTERMLFLK